MPRFHCPLAPIALLFVTSVAAGQGQHDEIRSYALPGSIDAIAWSPDRTTLAIVSRPARPGEAAGKQRLVQLWDVDQGEVTATALDTTDVVHGARFSPDGGTLAFAVWRTALVGFRKDRISEVDLWDVRARERKAKLGGAKCDILEVMFSPDGRHLAAGGKVTSDYPISSQHVSGEIDLWDLRDGGKLVWQEHRAHTDNVYALAFSPDGQTLASAGGDKVIKLWDLDGRRLKSTWYGHGRDGVSSIDFSPDGRALASGGQDMTARLWSVGNGESTHALTGFVQSAIVRVAFSPDGTAILIAGTARLEDGKGIGAVKLCDAQTLKVRRELARRLGHVRAAAFSPDGRHAAVGTWGGELVIWSLPR